MKTYTIAQGHSLTNNQGQALSGGQEIELDDAAAEQFAHALVPAQAAQIADQSATDSTNE